MEQHGNDSRANKLCLIGLVCLILPILGIMLETLLPAGGNKVVAAISFIFQLMYVAGLVLMIYIRVKYPSNVFGKVLMWLHIIVAVIFVIMLIVAIVMCAVMINGCMSCMDDLLSGRCDFIFGNVLK